MPSSLATTARPLEPRLGSIIVAASAGNALEWFDLIVYGALAAPIGRAFFPAGNETATLLLTYGTFGVSFLMRPLGAVVLGAYADRAGRKASLMLSILLMMIGTGMTAVMPSYAMIGPLAPIGVLLARLIQGFSVGGEFGSATAFMVEHGPRRKGYLASWQFASQSVSALLAAGFGFALSRFLSPAALDSWGWRVPFLFGLLIGPVGWHIRRHLDETPRFRAAGPAEAPLSAVLRRPVPVLLAAGMLAVGTAGTYIIIYLPTYGAQALGLPLWAGFLAGALSALVSIAVGPPVGHWSDRFGRIPIMLVSGAVLLLTVWPSFALLAARPSLGMMIAVLAWLSLVKAIHAAPLPALMAEIFPVGSRATGMSLGYNIGVTLFGGFAPTAATWLIAATGSRLAPSYYLMATAAVTLAALWALRGRVELHD